MLVKTQAVVLRTIKYGENKLIVDFLTEQEGRLSCVVGRTGGTAVVRGGHSEDAEGETEEAVFPATEYSGGGT